MSRSTYSVTSCSGLMKTSTDSASSLKSCGRLVYSAERMRAILVGVRIQREGHLARHHVDFVAVGQRDDDVGLRRAGRFQHRRIGGVARHGADVEAVLQVAQDLLVDVDDGDLVRFLAREMMGCRAADLAGAEDDDFHLHRLQVRYWTISHLVPWLLEAHLHARVSSVAFDVEDDTFAELAMAHARAEAHAGHRRLFRAEAARGDRARQPACAGASLRSAPPASP